MQSPRTQRARPCRYPPLTWSSPSAFILPRTVVVPNSLSTAAISWRSRSSAATRYTLGGMRRFCHDRSAAYCAVDLEKGLGGVKMAQESGARAAGGGRDNDTSASATEGSLIRFASNTGPAADGQTSKPEATLRVRRKARYGIVVVWGSPSEEADDS